MQYERGGEDLHPLINEGIQEAYFFNKTSSNSVMDFTRYSTSKSGRNYPDQKDIRLY